MKVKLRFGMAGPWGSYRAGQVVDLPPEKATELLNSKPPQAEQVAEVETAAVRAPEQAARTSAPEAKVEGLTFPQSRGGGWWLLSNETKFQGSKEEAEAAEAALKE